ncbi:hypothetical protein DCO58_10835 [Helicobacter saguini]|uniref:Uncharacterized protein n=1 Tax=Helicobacter saguini TaxID=1548018 RepID=A0A6B0HN07_9HELI|nr:hypothetical protein [Helicobacter saguini]MWV61206.1 hypothetical protein [Helicobacter saguini]MWV68127.1 hypothetical protein [Helicobacter saguini]MWV70409.1 hypothetical protein [Helicobacter saguini]MWV72310.1 hypothetical protein [Helicobacter saguini]
MGEPLNSIPQHSFNIVPEYHLESKWGDLDIFLRYQGRFRAPTPTPTGKRKCSGTAFAGGKIL